MSTEENKAIARRSFEQESATRGSTAVEQQRVTLNWPTWVGLVVKTGKRSVGSIVMLSV